jgi:hypothetical protein
VLITCTAPTKLKCHAVASAQNENDATGYNLRAYILAVNTATSAQYPGRQTTTWLSAGDNTNGRHRQIVMQRLLFVDASPESPVSMRFYWAFQQDSGGSKQCTFRNMSMLIEASYAPGMPTDDEPDRYPSWGSSNLKARYVMQEPDDT